MKITLFSGLERNLSIERYTRELSAGFPPHVTTRIVCPEMSDGLRGKIYDRYVKYLAVARRESGDYNIVTTEAYGFLLGALPSERTIVVCHDVHPLLTRQWTGTYRLRYELSLRIMGSARRVVAVSNSTRDDLRAHCRYIADEKLAVVHSGLAESWSPVIDERALRQFRRDYTLTQSPIILHVGNDNWYKNFAEVLRAFAMLAIIRPRSSSKSARSAARTRLWQSGSAFRIESSTVRERPTTSYGCSIRPPMSWFFRRFTRGLAGHLWRQWHAGAP